MKAYTGGPSSQIDDWAIPSAKASSQQAQLGHQQPRRAPGRALALEKLPTPMRHCPGAAI